MTLLVSKVFAALMSFGLMQRMNQGFPDTILWSKSISENLKYVATVCCALDCDAKPRLLKRSYTTRRDEEIVIGKTQLFHHHHFCTLYFLSTTTYFGVNFYDIIWNCCFANWFTQS